VTARHHLLWVVALALLVVALAGHAEARHWRRGWHPYHHGFGYYGWGYPYWAFPPGGYYGPSNVWYVPPLTAEPSVVLPRKRCAGGRAPARWVKTKKDGRIVYQHVMSRCR
jgi:hypothetical protein